MIDELAAKLEPALAAIDLQLWGAEFAGSVRNRTLRIYIDNTQAAVSIDDCVRATRHLRAYLAVELPQALDYTLEVSSPGVDRSFFSPQQCHAYIGARVSAQLLLPLANGQRRLKGVLQAVSANNELSILAASGESYQISFNQLVKIKLLS